MRKSDDEHPHAAEDAGDAKQKLTWVAPRLRLLGNLRDLVLGGGKASSNIDMDPQTPGKRGMG